MSGDPACDPQGESLSGWRAVAPPLTRVASFWAVGRWLDRWVGECRARSPQSTSLGGSRLVGSAMSTSKEPSPARAASRVVAGRARRASGPRRLGSVHSPYRLLAGEPYPVRFRRGCAHVRCWRAAGPRASRRCTNGTRRSHTGGGLTLATAGDPPQGTITAHCPTRSPIQLVPQLLRSAEPVALGHQLGHLVPIGVLVEHHADDGGRPWRLVERRPGAGQGQ